MNGLDRPERRQAAADEELMEGYANGDTAAFQELFERYEGRVFRFLFRRTDSRERAEDLYQELFLRVHQHRESYDPSRPFATWFFSIAAHLLVDDQRRAYRRRERSLAERNEPLAPLDPERDLAASEAAQALLARLSAEERRVLLGSKVEGRSYPELAAELGKTAGAVKKLASRAMLRLRRESRNAGAGTAPSCPTRG